MFTRCPLAPFLVSSVKSLSPQRHPGCMTMEKAECGEGHLWEDAQSLTTIQGRAVGLGLILGLGEWGRGAGLPPGFGGLVQQGSAPLWRREQENSTSEVFAHGGKGGVCLRGWRRKYLGLCGLSHCCFHRWHLLKRSLEKPALTSFGSGFFNPVGVSCGEKSPHI